ncbi:MAG: glycosyltransferase family 4 protein [Nitrospirae bacterium]|nr:glycosyltransferase family 4 protein [Nitrospirota bacterium]
MEKTRVLLVISNPGWGGTEAYVSLLAKGLKEHGCQVWVASPKSSAVSRNVSGIQVIAISSFPLLIFYNLFKIFFFVLFHKIHIIHGNSGKDYWLVLLAGFFSGKKVVLTRHLMTRFSKHTQQMVILEKSIVIAPSNATLHVLKESGIPASCLVRIYNGIDSAPYQLSHGKFRILYRLPPHAFVTGIVSNIHFPKGKGHFTILQSLPEILKRIPEAYWMIGGSGPLLPALMRRVKELRVEDRVIFTGHLQPQQVPHFLSSLDLFVLLSYDQEGGCPLAIMEAMASGLPVISSHIGGNKEIVEDGKTGFLISPEDDNALVKYSIDLFENPDRRKSMGHEGKQRIENYFNEKRMSEETLKVYDAILTA